MPQLSWLPLSKPLRATSRIVQLLRTPTFCEACSSTCFRGCHLSVSFCLLFPFLLFLPLCTSPLQSSLWPCVARQWCPQCCWFAAALCRTNLSVAPACVPPSLFPAKASGVHPTRPLFLSSCEALASCSLFWEWSFVRFVTTSARPHSKRSVLLFRLLPSPCKVATCILSSLPSLYAGPYLFHNGAYAIELAA